jgi:hypothetical protein
LNLPSIIQSVYKTKNIVFTGLYSFEFVDANRNTITEIFLMQPPKTKTVDEPTRSTTVPTLSGNYNNDAGNGTKTIKLSGDLYFPDMGSPENPVARDNSGLRNLRSGLDEFFCLRWFLVRYRDYTMTKTGKISDPGNALNVNPQLAKLYNAVSKRLKRKVGALYDEISVIIHDYDMDDHWYCRIANFSSSQTDQKHIAVSYTIDVECYEPNSKSQDSVQAKKTTAEMVDVLSTSLSDLDYDSVFSDIQFRIGYNPDFISVLVGIGNTIDLIISENELIQTNERTALDNIPIYTARLAEYIRLGMEGFKDNFLSIEQQTSYSAGDLTLDEIVEIELVYFFNILQKIKIYNDSMAGVVKTAPPFSEIRYSENSNLYRLMEEQFDSTDERKFENDTTFYYYTVMEGDTSRLIAMRELKDPEQFWKILDLNSITENDFIEGTMIGKQIKIPLVVSGAGRGSDNLVYETNQDDIASFLYGTDISTGINNDLMLSGTGDIATVSGSDNVVSQIERRISNRKGSLNTVNPGWGVLSPDDGNAPLLVKVERYLNSVIEQVRKDPRVQTAQMDLDRLDWSGEALSVPVKIELVNNEASEVIING